jgi:hypothetical protein
MTDRPCVCVHTRTHKFSRWWVRCQIYAGDRAQGTLHCGRAEQRTFDVRVRGGVLCLSAHGARLEFDLSSGAQRHESGISPRG